MKAKYNLQKKAIGLCALGIVILVSVVLIRVSQPKADRLNDTSSALKVNQRRALTVLLSGSGSNHKTRIQ